MTSPRKPKRFYKDVCVSSGESGHGVLLDGKPLRTPSKAVFTVPQRALAEAIAQEWRDQGEVIDAQGMILFRLANTAVERVATTRGAVIDELIGYGGSDLLCYRAEHPQSLVMRQQETWDPLLDWLHQRFGARLTVAHGVVHVAQPAEALAHLRSALEPLHDFALTGLAAATTLLGSLVLGLALHNGQLGAAEAFAAATLDEAFQAERWGEDADAKQRRDAHAAELAGIARYLALVTA